MEPQKLDLNSMNITGQKKQLLKEVFPEVFTEGDKIDYDKLRAVLGEDIDTTGREKYGMSWPGKKNLIKIIQEQSRGTLRPVKEDSVSWDSTEHVFIEGDNLEVLKLLQKSYLGKIKMIYIDPPYNTGKDFVYPDNYTESLETYLKYTGQKSDEGKRFGVNLETDGRFHSKWLNMMYPRLFLARNLLREDGVIFISIDDNEVANLRKVCDEIFGSELFISDIIWEKRFTRNNDAKLMSSVIDHILVYRKSLNLNILREERSEKTNSIYSNPDNDHRGPWTSVSYISQRTKEQRPNLAYEIKNSITGVIIIHPTNAWKYSKKQYEIHQNENRLYWGKNGENKYPRLKRFLAELSEGIVPINLWNYKDTGTIDKGTKTVDALLGKDVFDYPKPASLIQRMLKIVSAKNNSDIILDFFAGSLTTAHAVLNLNKKDGGNRKFIMVQLPELCAEDTEAFKVGYKTIADIGKERIRRVIKKIDEEQSEELDFDKSKQDLGFKVYKLDTSNFKPWSGEIKNTEDLGPELEGFIDPFIPGRTQEDILFEILLKSGYELSAKIEEITIAGKRVFSISGGDLLICLEDEVTEELFKDIADKEPIHFICLDKAFGKKDDLKANAVLTFKAKQNADGTPKTIFKTV